MFFIKIKDGYMASKFIVNNSNCYLEFPNRVQESPNIIKNAY
jgi:hypothetical protein